MCSTFRRNADLLREGFAEILQGAGFVDLRVVASDATLYFHQMVLASASLLMKTVLGDPEVHNSEIATILLPDFDQTEVLEMVQFLYGLKSFGEKLQSPLVHTLQLGFDLEMRPPIETSLDECDSLMGDAEPIPSPEPSEDPPIDPRPQAEVGGRKTIRRSSRKREFEVDGSKVKLSQNTRKKNLERTSGGWKCMKCQVEKRFQHEFKAHEATCGRQGVNPVKVKKSRTPPAKPVKVNPDLLFSCGGCELSLASFSELKSHLDTEPEHQDLTFVCETCEKVFTSEPKAEKHQFVHQKEISCNHCQKPFTNATKYAKHLNNVHRAATEGEHKCPKCSKSFEYLKNFVNHVKRHETEPDFPVTKEFKCHICQMALSTRSTLLYHVSKHVQSKFPCHRCDKIFKSERGLKYHLKIHDGQLDYLCSDCGRGFITRQKLLNHRRSKHTFEKPYVCDACGQGFIRSDKLVIHKRRAHTGEKPYRCDSCPWRGVDTSALIHHKKRHENEERKMRMESSIPEGNEGGEDDDEDESEDDDEEEANPLEHQPTHQILTTLTDVVMVPDTQIYIPVMTSVVLLPVGNSRSLGGYELLLVLFQPD
eukprot:snap_masked-scaffold924_size80766-processed-gene-0.7 protein:Tk12432 transcript:snap_masked-scaffold924_size80766-processed-gene-0.7-mRNA-1 annotation:"zinc finger protein 850-like"